MEKKSARERLLALKQGRRHAAEYALEFHTLAAESGWNDSAVRVVYRNGLNEELLRELACRDEAAPLDTLIRMSIKLDNLLKERLPKFQGRHKLACDVSPPVFSQQGSQAAHITSLSCEPMEINCARLTHEEQDRRYKEKLCFYCGSDQHQIRQFPRKCRGRSHTNEDPPTAFTVSLMPTFSVTPMDILIIIHYANRSHVLSALIDSGSSGNFMDQQVAERLGISLHRLRHPPQIYSINSAPIGRGSTTHCTETISLQTSWLHEEKIILLITYSPKHDVIFGLPWLKLRNPAKSWENRTITKCS